MRLIHGFRRGRSTALALVAALVIVGPAVARHMSNPPTEASPKAEEQSSARLRRGVGGEVRFASAASRPEQIGEAVGSADEFIYWRSGLRMSDETKKRLTKAESDVLKGKTKHITLGALTDNLTTAVVDRLATLTDKEIELAAESASDAHGEIRARADGKWGVLTKRELIQQAKSGREWSRQGDSALRATLRPMIEEQVNNRAAVLSAAIPEQFGRAVEQGVTPTQALLIAYSVATDDPLTDSRSDIERIIVQKRMDARVTREQWKAQKNVSGRPYGPRGLMHPSAPQLFFKAGIEKLLNHSEGGKQ